MKKRNLIPFLKHVRHNNKGADVGIMGIMLIFVSATILAMGLDLFTTMLGKEYTINAMQSAEIYALVQNVDNSHSITENLSIDVTKVVDTYYSEIRRKLMPGPSTPFRSIKYMKESVTANTVKDDPTSSETTSAGISAYILFEPKRYIRNPMDFLSPSDGINVDKVYVKTRVVSYIYVFSDN